MSSAYPLWFVVPGAVLSFITVVGNGLVVYLIITRKRLRNATNWIVLSLAVADFSVGAGYLPGFILLSSRSVVRYSVVSFLSSASALNLSLLTLDRYVFIAEPLQYLTLMTTKRVALFIFTAWTVSFVPHLVLYLTATKDSTAPESFLIFDFVIFEVLPMIALPFFAGRIFLIVRHQEQRIKIQMRQLHFNQSAETLSEMSSGNKRTSTMKFIGGAVAVFFTCYLSESILSAQELKTIARPDSNPVKVLILRNVAALLYIMNSAINPVVYALFKSDIKKSLRRMLHCSGDGTEVRQAGAT